MSNNEKREIARAALAGVSHDAGAAKPDPILIADGVTRQFGGLTAVNVEHVEIQRGAITALIGPNGSGKTRNARWPAFPPTRSPGWEWCAPSN